MAFIGKTPTPAPLTSSDIASDIINNTHIGDTAISGFSALGAEPADTDEFLISDAGTLKRMDYSYIKGGGRYTLLSSATISGGSTYVDMDDVFTDTYKNYLLVATGIDVGTDATSIHLQVKNSSGLLNGASDYEFASTQTHTNSSTASIAYDAGQDYINLTRSSIGNAAVEHVNLSISFKNPRSTTFYKLIMAKKTGIDTNEKGYFVHTIGMVQSTTALTGLRIKMSSGNLDAGVLKLYGAND